MKTLLLSSLVLLAFGTPLAFSTNDDDVDVKEKHTGSICKASDLIGYTVMNRANESLGKIEDLAIDTKSGRIQYAVLSFGGFLGMGDKLFAIPFESITVSEEKTAYLDIDKERLKAAPGFDKDNWPNLSDPNWNRDVYKFYGREYVGYDAERARVRDGMVQGGGSARYQGWGADSDYVRKFDSKKIESLAGTVVLVSKAAPVKGMADGVQVTVRPTGSAGAPENDVIAHFGPAAYWDSQAFMVKREDTLKLKGSYSVIEGKRVFCVSEVTRDGKTVKLRNADGTSTWNAEALRSASGDSRKGQ